MTDIIVLVILLAIIAFSIAYMIKEKKKGVKCIGCPAAGQCAHAKNGGCSCGSHTDTKEKISL